MSGEPARMVLGARAVNEIAGRLYAEATRELAICTRDPLHADVTVEDAMQGAIQRGVLVRSITSREFVDGADAALRRYLETLWRRRSPPVRALPTLESKLIIADRQEALLVLNRERGAEVRSLHIQHRVLVAELVEAFERKWERAADLF